MKYQISKIADVPLVMVRLNRDFGDVASLKAYAHDLKELYDSLETPVYQIADLTDLRLNFDDIVNAIQVVIRGENTIVHHPNNLDLLLVTNNRFYQMAARGLNTVTFGYVEMLIFASVEAAMSRVKDHLQIHEHHH